MRSPKRGRRWPWVLLGSGMVVGGLLAYSPTLFGGLLLARLGGQFGLATERVSGPLWSPSLSNATVTLPGVRATAGSANVRATSVNPLTHTAHIRVAVSGANVKLDLKRLFEGSGQSGGKNGQGGWKVILDGLED